MGSVDNEVVRSS